MDFHFFRHCQERHPKSSMPIFWAPLRCSFPAPGVSSYSLTCSRKAMSSASTFCYNFWCVLAYSTLVIRREMSFLIGMAQYLISLLATSWSWISSLISFLDYFHFDILDLGRSKWQHARRSHWIVWSCSCCPLPFEYVVFSSFEFRFESSLSFESTAPVIRTGTSLAAERTDPRGIWPLAFVVCNLYL